MHSPMSLSVRISGAADRLIKLMDSRDEQIQLRSCNSLLEHYTSLISNNEILRRIEILEAATVNK